ncbi:hypothetical protein [Polaromonas sp. YR568]|uniref:hypothetical protein n=1 Tax=Polaromonas sp. YR568 TaxID=1855301 RepID=UPI00398BC235
MPGELEITFVYSMIEVTYRTQISQKGVIKAFLDRNRNEHQEALALLARQAPADANAIVGIKVSSAAQDFGSEAFLYLTYIGTPVIYAEG